MRIERNIRTKNSALIAQSSVLYFALSALLLALSVSAEAQQPAKGLHIGLTSSNASRRSDSGDVSSEPHAQSGQSEPPAPPSPIQSPPPKPLRLPRLRLPTEPLTPIEPERPSIFGIPLPEWVGKVVEDTSPFVFACILVAVAGGSFHLWRKDAARKKREKDYLETVKRDWGSVEILTKVLTQTAHLRDDSKNWTEEEWRTYRQNDISKNVYDYDQLWDIWKRYELRQFGSEIHALSASGWRKEEIILLMNFYVRETKARWQLLRERDH